MSGIPASKPARQHALIGPWWIDVELCLPLIKMHVSEAARIPDHREVWPDVFVDGHRFRIVDVDTCTDAPLGLEDPPMIAFRLA
jgi:hypothetical protein